jgi:excinuclease ABC subunit A
MSVPVPPKRRKPQKGPDAQAHGARGNNLKNVTAEIPLGTFTCITGVSAAASPRS